MSFVEQRIDKIVANYKRLASIPALVKARLVGNGTVINSVWSQRNLDRCKTVKFTKTHYITKEFSKVFESSFLDTTSEVLVSISPSENLRALIREVEEKEGRRQYLEIWSAFNLAVSVDLHALDLHGDVYTDGEFGSLVWSPDECSLLYVAEKKEVKSEPFYKRKSMQNLKQGDSSTQKEDNSTTKGEQYLFKQDWGEQLVGKKQSVIVEYNFITENFKVLEGIPEGLCPAHPVWSPNGSYIVGVAYRTTPRKLGVIYCTNRPSAIFALDFNKKYHELSASDKAVKSPRFSPNGKNLIWLQRNAAGPHHSCMQLVKRDASASPTKEIISSVVVDIVNIVVSTTNGCDFHGLYNTSFSERCWTSDGRLVLSTNQKNTTNTYVVDIDTGSITELSYTNGSQIVLDVYQDIILVNRRNYFIQDTLAIGHLLPKNHESETVFLNVTEPHKIEASNKFVIKYLDLKHPNSTDTVDTFSAIYVGPDTGNAKEVPLVVMPHGGPYSSFSNCLSLETSLYFDSGLALLFINFRGSVGSGQASIDFLPGKIGKSDVADCILATQETLRVHPNLDPNCIGLVGGSYGGFLVTHLSGQYPDMFKTVVARNPVIDFATLSQESDIPDLCFEAVGKLYSQVGHVDNESLLLMRKGSPIEYAHNVKAPTLLQVGSKDLRVPPGQATDYYHRLKANGVLVRMNVYEDNHPLGAFPHEMDNLINSINWICQHLNVTLL